jgi:hypothetical protein
VVELPLGLVVALACPLLLVPQPGIPPTVNAAKVASTETRGRTEAPYRLPLTRRVPLARQQMGTVTGAPRP